MKNQERATIDIFPKIADISFRVFVGNTLVGYWIKALGFVAKTHVEKICSMFSCEIPNASSIERLTAVGFESFLIVGRDSDYFSAAISNSELRDTVRVFNGKEAVVICTANSKINSQRIVDYCSKLSSELKIKEEKKILAIQMAKIKAAIAKDQMKFDKDKEEFEKSGMKMHVDSDFGQVAATVYKDNKLFGLVMHKKNLRDIVNLGQAVHLIQYSMIDYALNMGLAHEILDLDTVTRLDIVSSNLERVEHIDCNFNNETRECARRLGISVHGKNGAGVEAHIVEAKCTGILNPIFKGVVSLYFEQTLDGKPVFVGGTDTSSYAYGSEIVKGLLLRFKTGFMSINGKREYVMSTVFGDLVGAVYRKNKLVGFITSRSRSQNFVRMSEFGEIEPCTSDGGTDRTAMDVLAVEIVEAYNEIKGDSRNIDIGIGNVGLLKRYDIEFQLAGKRRAIKAVLMRDVINTEGKYSNFECYNVCFGTKCEGKTAYVKFSKTEDGAPIFIDRAMGYNISEDILDELAVRFIPKGLIRRMR